MAEHTSGELYRKKNDDCVICMCVILGSELYLLFCGISLLRYNGQKMCNEGGLSMTVLVRRHGCISR